MAGQSLSRRSFLKMAGAAIGSAATGGFIGWRIGNRPLASPTTTPTASSPPTNTVASPTATTTIQSSPPSTQAPPATIASTAESSTSPQVSRLDTIRIVPERAWGQAPVESLLRPHSAGISLVTIHHTAALLLDNRDAPAHARGHQRYHKESGWGDLAYHFLIDRNGTVLQGRPVEYRGDTFTSYDPDGHLLICLEGNLDQQHIGDQQIRALIAMVAWGLDEHGLQEDVIGGHRDYAGTSCPGDLFYPRYLEDGTLAGLVMARRRLGRTTLDVLNIDAGRSFVAKIEAGTDLDAAWPT